MVINKPENVILKKTHAKSKIALEDLSFMRDKDDRSLLDKTRDDIVILQVMPLERHGALVEYVTAEVYKKEPLVAVFDLVKLEQACSLCRQSDT